MIQKCAPTLVTDVFVNSIDQAMSQQLMAGRQGTLENIISGTVGQVFQEMENRQQAQKDAAAPTILDCALQYIADRCETGFFTSKTAKENMAIIQCIVRIIGDKALNDITYQDTVAVRKTLRQLPPNINKSPKWRNLSIGQILDLQPGSTLSLQSVNKYLSRFSTFLNWYQKRGMIQTNQFHGAKIKGKEKASASRKVFTMDDLQLLFSVENFQFKPQDIWRGYIMLIALTSGMRLEEICQLECCDIVTVDGLPCFDINDNGGKRLKNSSSRRVIPIHSTLASPGEFLSFVEQQAIYGKRAFPKLKQINGSYGHSYSKWFRKYRESCGIYDPGKVFHSFRHTITTFFKEDDVPVYVAAEILGHSVKGLTYGQYGKESSVSKMKTVIEQLPFE